MTTPLPAKPGSPWTAAELDLIVADHFAMLSDELAGIPFVKSHRAAALMDLTGRSHRSVEFKHMNLSAVLDALGLPTIRGYRPTIQGNPAQIKRAAKLIDEAERPLPLISHRVTEAGVEIYDA